MRWLQKTICLAVLFFVPTTATRADAVTLVSNRDTTIYHADPSKSNGAGQAMFVGETGTSGACRSLVGFDIAGNIPAGSTITDVQLTLVLAGTASRETKARQIELHRLLADWGEGSAGQGSGATHGGQGFATAADGTAATWTHRFFSTVPWTDAGGDFAATASAATMVGSQVNTAFVWGTTPAMVQDVQGWLDAPSSNFGWLLLGDESTAGTNRLFFTREAQTSGMWPSLVVHFTPPNPISTRLVITAPASITAGSAFSITVTAVDNSGGVATGYTGMVAFTTSDSFPGVLPAGYTFTSDDQGTHTFTGVTLFTAGAQTLGAQDTANPSILGSATVGVGVAPADHLLITVPQNAVSGTAFDVALAALDPYGNADPNYSGTVTWTSTDTDPGVIVPADYTFQAADRGMHIFPAGATLITLGDQTFTAMDTVSGITGSAIVSVGAGP
jgi:hypothetical protein